ncbi:hypothetical protein ACOTH8_21565 [Achromobacter xylosoxidans]
MTQQDDITQRVLTDDEIMQSAISACDSLNITRFHEIGAPSKTIMDDAGLLELGRALEGAVLSKLRAPVADERAAFETWANNSFELHRHAGTEYSSRVTQCAWAAWEARAALASAPVAEPRLEWSAKALYDAIKDVLLNHRLSNLVDEDGEFFPLVDHLRSQDDKATESGEFEIALICDAIYNDVLTRSAPVAGEQIIAWDVQDTGLGRRYTTYNPKVAEDLMNLGENVRPLVYASALPPANPAPQASAEDVRNAALEEAAAFLENNRTAWQSFRAAYEIRALKQPQADKDGGQQLDGDVDERAAFEAWAYRAGMGPKFRESMFAAWEARAALSAPQAEQGERDA